MNKKIKCFVVASVLLNLLLVGVIIGHMSHRFGPRPPFREPPEIASLTPEKQEIFREAMKAAREKSEGLRKQSRKLRKESAEILAAPTFDKDAYYAKMKEMMALHQQRKLNFAEAVAGIAEKFTPEERKLLAKSMRRPMPGGGEGPPPPPPGDGPPPPQPE